MIRINPSVLYFEAQPRFTAPKQGVN